MRQATVASAMKAMSFSRAPQWGQARSRRRRPSSGDRPRGRGRPGRARGRGLVSASQRAMRRRAQRRVRSARAEAGTPAVARSACAPSSLARRPRDTAELVDEAGKPVARGQAVAGNDGTARLELTRRRGVQDRREGRGRRGRDRHGRRRGSRRRPGGRGRRAAAGAPLRHRRGERRSVRRDPGRCPARPPALRAGGGRDRTPEGAPDLGSRLVPRRPRARARGRLDPPPPLGLVVAPGGRRRRPAPGEPLTYLHGEARRIPVRWKSGGPHVAMEPVDVDVHVPAAGSWTSALA